MVGSGATDGPVFLATLAEGVFLGTVRRATDGAGCSLVFAGCALVAIGVAGLLETADFGVDLATDDWAVCLSLG